MIITHNFPFRNPSHVTNVTKEAKEKKKSIFLNPEPQKKEDRRLFKL